MNKADLRDLPSPFYRVATRAVIFDGQHRLLVLKDDDHKYELPGGGWEHDETFEQSMRREIDEELHVACLSVGTPWFTYRGHSERWGYIMLRIAAPVALASHDFRADDEHIAARFVTREEFLTLNWCQEDREIIQYVDTLWPSSTPESFYPPENYYRVSAKALVFDDSNRLLVFQTSDAKWEMPGGGWDHSEDYETCIRRELAEEIGAGVESVGPLAFFYRCEALRGHPKISLAFPVKLASLANLKLGTGDDLINLRFVTKQEFAELPFQKGERVVQQYADQIWSTVEKNRENR